MPNYQKYEMEKRRLQNLNLSYEEYQKQLKTLIKVLKI
jgi:hypothetical protein